MERKQGIRKAVCAAMAALFLSMSFALCVSVETEALEFVDITSLNTPWTSTFRPLDSAWDSTGTQCVVVGNDTSGIQPSAWHYNEPSNTWTPIMEGSDASIPAVHLVENDATGSMYASIQAAIDAATAGDELHVWSGTYSENILIDKQLTVLGNGSASTVIDGNNAGIPIRIIADGVTINGFTVTGGADHTGILLYEADNCRIENNTVEGNGDGICVSGSSNNIIKKNDIRNNAGTGVRTQSSPAAKTLIGLTESGGSSGSGAMFQMSTDGMNYSVMHNFKLNYLDGKSPENTKFIQDSIDPSVLYSVTGSGGVYDRGTIFKTTTSGTPHVVLHNFTIAEGYPPSGALTIVGSVLYGATQYGGMYDYGTIFRMDKDGSDFEIMYNFNNAEGAYPRGGLLYYDNALYGMASNGGVTGHGVIFKIQTDGSMYTRIHNFDGTAANGRYPYGSLINIGTTMYGMTNQGGTFGYGTIFRINTDGTAFTLMHSFNSTTTNGRYPYGDLMLYGTNFYGMTPEGGTFGYGTIFRIGTGGTGFTLLHSFNSTITNGRNPYNSLVTDGINLYGLTLSGGLWDQGTAFRIALGGTGFTILVNFETALGYNPRSSLLRISSTLYGLTSYGNGFDGSTFRVNTDGSGFSVLHIFNPTPTDGTYPTGGAVQSGTSIYGMTSNGFSTTNSGGIYSMNIDGTGYAALHAFAGPPEGAYPWGLNTPIIDGTAMYGMTQSGGASGTGTIFSMNTDGTGFTTLHSFDYATDGAYPSGALIQDGATLYGMTTEGGLGGEGTIFCIGTDGLGFSVIHEFTGAIDDGSYPYSNLTQDGFTLYGVTYFGGAIGSGTVFRINKDGSDFTLLHSFLGGGTDGLSPYATPTLVGTTLYGATRRGGTNNYGTIYRINTDGSDFALCHSFTYSEGISPRSHLVRDGQMLYSMTTDGGMYGYGSVIKFNIATLVLTPLHHFQEEPDANYPYLNQVALISHTSLTSGNNLIYHNNFIDNAVQASNDDPFAQLWDSGLPDGGNYWNDHIGADADLDGMIDTPRTIDGIAGVSDWFPWNRIDGWSMPYTTFRNVIWDNVNDRFWLCGDVSSAAESELYYITAADPTVMIPIPTGTPQSFTAMASDTLGNILIGGNNLQYIYYYVPSTQMGYPVSESGTGKMYGWNITGMTYNPNDSRFYIVGNMMGEDKAVAFATAAGPLTGSPSYCYIDISSLLNSPGIGTLRSIEWNPDRDYALAVGDGVYRLDEWWGTGNPLSWSVIQEPQAGIVYNDISWDSDGYVEAGIVGREGFSGKYWRYYHTNPTLLEGYTSTLPFSNYWTCAMKPPSSPKWLIIPAYGEISRINLEEKDESGTITFASEYPQIFSVEISKQSDVTHPDLMDTQVDADSTYTFFIESNYTVGGFDHWNDLAISLSAWYDGNAVGMASSPGSWASDVYRTKQFNVTYDPATNTAALVYPSPVAPAGEEFSVDSSWEDPAGHGADGFTHYLYINVTFGPQTWAATGPSTPSGGSWSKNLALNDLNTWDLQVHMYDTLSTGNYNLTYMEFGIKEFAEIASSGSPSGTAPPGTTNFHLSTPCTIYYATNTEHYVTVSISNLYFGGDPLETKFIPATKLQTENLHPLATPVTSDISSQTYFAAAGTPLYVWGLSTLVPEGPPEHGTQMAGPDNTDYTGALTPPFVQTTIDWWIDVPVSITSGIYIGTITITIMN